MNCVRKIAAILTGYYNDFHLHTAKSSGQFKPTLKVLPAFSKKMQKWLTDDGRMDRKMDGRIGSLVFFLG